MITCMEFNPEYKVYCPGGSGVGVDIRGRKRREEEIWRKRMRGCEVYSINKQSSERGVNNSENYQMIEDVCE